MGIFKDTYITYGEEVKIESVYLYTKEADERSAQVVAEIELANYAQGAMLDIMLFTPSGELTCHKSRYCCEETVKEYLDIMAPKLWYPNGYGQQPLYRFCIQVDGLVSRQN